MVTSIFLDKNNNLYFGENFPIGRTQDIGEIEFNIFHKLSENRQIFLILEDNQGVKEVIELQSLKNSGEPYKIYKLSLDQKIRISSENVKISILTLEIGTDNYTISNELNIKISMERYNLSREIYLSVDLGAKVSNYYKQIVLLLEQLIEENEEERGS